MYIYTYIYLFMHIYMSVFFCLSISGLPYRLNHLAAAASADESQDPSP